MNRRFYSAKAPQLPSNKECSPCLYFFAFHVNGYNHRLVVSCIFKEATKETFQGSNLLEDLVEGRNPISGSVCISWIQEEMKTRRWLLGVSRDGTSDDFLPVILDRAELQFYASFVFRWASERDSIFYVLVYLFLASMWRYFSQNEPHSNDLCANVFPSNCILFLWGSFCFAKIANSISRFSFTSQIAWWKKDFFFLHFATIKSSTFVLWFFNYLLWSFFYQQIVKTRIMNE